MKSLHRTAAFAFAFAVAATFLAPLTSRAQQLPTDPVERAKAIAQIMAANARQLTIFDRAGKVLNRVGNPDLYGRPALSPDGKRVAVAKADLDKETQDVWILDVATGQGPKVTTSERTEGTQDPAWSPDGRYIAYVALRAGQFGLYRKAPTPEAPEERLYTNNAPMTLTEWTTNGRYLMFFSSDLSGGGLYAVPLEATGERKAIEIFRDTHQVQGPHVSPDARYVSYVSNESGRNEIYVRPFTTAGGAAEKPRKISTEGGQGLAYWRSDGKELFYLGANRALMAVPVTASSTSVEFGKPAVLFQPGEGIQLGPGNTNVSRDGQRFSISVPQPALRQLTVFDRQGKTVATIGQPGMYLQPQFSPDGKHVVVVRNDPQSGDNDIWTFDVATGKGTAVTSDAPPDQFPIWSPDGKSVAYVSTRGSYSEIYRKAADGTGAEEMLFRYTPGAGMLLSDWSPDGKFVTFFNGVVLLVPLRAGEDASKREAIEWLREDYNAGEARFSPDGRFIAYLSDEVAPDRLELYVRPFDAAKPDAPLSGTPVRVSKDGLIGMISWRQDGKEMYFMTRDWEVMAADIATAPTLRAGAPKVLFKLQGPLPGNPVQWNNVSRDGERFVFAMPTARGAPR
jgi:Tol biopolymer transport system component